MAHELRPIDYFVDYKQAIHDVRNNREPSVSHLFKDPSQLAESSKVISASPFRATVRLDREKMIDSPSSKSEEDQFERDTMSYRDNRSRKDSPIKEDYELMRTQWDNYLASFAQRSTHQFPPLTERSQRMPHVKNKSIIVHEQQVRHSSHVNSPGLNSPTRRPFTAQERHGSLPLTFPIKIETEPVQAFIDAPLRSVETRQKEQSQTRLRSSSQNMRKERESRLAAFTNF